MFRSTVFRSPVFRSPVFSSTCGFLLALSMCAPAHAQQFTGGNTLPSSGSTMGDIARQYREKKRSEVKMTERDKQEIFSSVDRILAFASQDTGLSRHASVGRLLLGQADVEQRVQQRMGDDKSAQRLERTELTLKKFGLLPRDFQMRAVAASIAGENIAAFYDPKTKTIYLMNWMPAEQQRPVLAHELTHALQDQNFNLLKWTLGLSETDRKPNDAPRDNVATEMDPGEQSSGRVAVIEGQAMIVLVDYNLSEYGASLQRMPQLIESMKNRMESLAETPSLHQAPLVLRNGLIFPYREGFAFEAELLVHGGKESAFTRPFARPPVSTHEVLHPEAYLVGEKTSNPAIPSLQALIGNTYEPLDSGTIGEMDLRTLIQQFEGKLTATQLSPSWNGGSYVAMKRISAGSGPLTTKDVALVYVSKWKSEQAAQRFANLYAASVAHRYATVSNLSSSCSGACASLQFNTEEGPVVVERWKNLVLATEGFDQDTAQKLRTTLLGANSTVTTVAASTPDLTLRFAASPEFGALRQALDAEIFRALHDVQPTAARP